MSERRVPRIRFRGFEDDWEQRKVGELLIERNEQAPMNEEYPLMAFIANEGVAPKGERYDRSSLVTDTENKLYKRTEFGDFIYSSNNLETGSIGLNKYGKACISPVYSVFHPTGIADFNFLGRRLVRKDFINSMVKWRQGVIYGQWRIHESDFLKIDISVPSVEEQIQIGTFLDYLDNLITLHQRKLEKLKIVKKAMLENCFPKNGEKSPRIRFGGFTDDWEQRKLSECAGFRRGSFPQPYGNKEWYDGEGAMPFVQVADVSDDMKLVDDTKQKISKSAQPMSVYADKGSVLVTLQGSIGRVAITQYGTFVDRTVLIFDKYNQDIDKTFWAYIIKEKFIDEARKAPGGTIKTITKEALSDFDLMLPNYDEQKKLGAFLVSIDNLITLHQCKLEKLKDIKKSMLEKMFV
ncbi:MAG: restriction endonuclease subunit S [Lachnospiraceae bacterium]|jgi:type I restriction enzyme S subunit|nr:restriction endonuclease subunit S [Lachnospiraceae bacterium]MCI1655974.1 restriction endonuclease subunit S [Lachnospiraceae bacterium]MCI2194456.1 restriction endonuclease subunit S [Lachnospiraceae bacterium]